MIIQIVGFLTAMVWGYSQLTTRISFVENQAERNGKDLAKIKSDLKVYVDLTMKGK